MLWFRLLVHWFSVIDFKISSSTVKTILIFFADTRHINCIVRSLYNFWKFTTAAIIAYESDVLIWYKEEVCKYCCTKVPSSLQSFVLSMDQISLYHKAQLRFHYSAFITLPIIYTSNSSVVSAFSWMPWEILKSSHLRPSYIWLSVFVCF